MIETVRPIPLLLGTRAGARGDGDRQPHCITLALGVCISTVPSAELRNRFPDSSC